MNSNEMLGKYRIFGELGRGAMGVVYEAFDTLIERPVAIKTVMKSAISASEAEELFSRFRREARAAGRLTHPKVISIYDYGENDEMAYIVMELVRGRELSEYLDHGKRMSLAEGLNIVMQLLDALDYLHAHGVVHRDIKPSNIMVTEDLQVKIADFGIAKIDASGHTQVGVVLGTPTYMAPEQFMGHEVDHRADLYAAGVILYLLLTGERPFVGSVIAIMHQAVHRDAPPPSQLNSLVTAQLDAVVKKAMAKRPEDRFQSAKKFLKAIKIAVSALDPAVHAASEALKLNESEALVLDETLELPGGEDSTGSWREADIAAWQDISHSQNSEDYIRYLQKFPDGGFAALAQKRIEALKQAAMRAAEEAALARQEALVREAREKLQAESAARMKDEEQKKALLARKIVKIKTEAQVAKSLQSSRREKEAALFAQRAKELSAALTERAEKIADVVLDREADSDAERKMKMEAKRHLEEEVQRKRQARAQLLSAREEAEKQAEAAIEQQRLRAAAELEARNREIEEAKALAQLAERRRQEAEERAALESKKNSYKMLMIGVFLMLLLIGIVFGLLPASK